MSLGKMFLCKRGVLSLSEAKCAEQVKNWIIVQKDESNLPYASNSLNIPWGTSLAFVILCNLHYY